MKPVIVDGIKCLIVCIALWAGHASYAQDVTGRRPAPGYVAKQEGMRTFFGAISAQIGKPIVVSKAAAAKQVSGEFEIASPNFLNDISRQLGLITYYDGHAIYVYDASETKTVVITVKHVSPSSLQSFLKSARLTDARYPLRSNGLNTLYVSGPPIYVDLVAQTAESMDQEISSPRDQRVEIIRLQNTFVTDRAYTRRDESVVIPGIATVIQRLLSTNTDTPVNVEQVSASERPVQARLDGSGVPSLDSPIARPATEASRRADDSSSPLRSIRIIAYPDTNSLLVKGSAEQVRIVRSIVHELDQEKRHVELALWIIDLQKDDLSQLGIKWHGAAQVGNAFGVSFNAAGNSSYTTVGGATFIASVLALARDNRAQIVSRPVVLTQENTPAMFDNSHTFYTQLIGERAVELQQVTYGTMVNVLPRFTSRDDIELSVNIEDGSAAPQDSTNSETEALPTVSRTKISTVARVPRGKSLLVGGYTRGETGAIVSKIPVLGDLPFIGGVFRYKQSHNKNTVRVFLITPREILDGLDLQLDGIQDQADFADTIRQLDKTRAMTSDLEEFSNGA